jgi:L-cysteine desulfidase
LTTKDFADGIFDFKIENKELIVNNFTGNLSNIVCDGLVISNEGLLKHQYAAVFQVVLKIQEEEEVDRD